MTGRETPLGGGQPGKGIAQRYHFLLEEGTDSALLLLDAGGNVLEWGGSAARLFGYRRNEIVGEHFCRLFFRPEEVRRGEPEFELRAADVNGEAKSERWYVRQDGTTLRCRSVTAAVRKCNADRPVFVMVVRDVTAPQARRTQPAAANDFRDLLLALNDCREYLLNTLSSKAPIPGGITPRPAAAVAVPDR